jgi:Glycosyl hydrolase family 62
MSAMTRSALLIIATWTAWHAGFRQSRADDPLAGPLAWTASAPLIAPAVRGDDPCVSIKDPSVVSYHGKWHVFVTIRCRSGVKLESLSFAGWDQADRAPRHVIALVDAYHCAPQVFHFRPQKKWYLIYQWARGRDDFGPAFSTLDDVDRPETLTPSAMLYPKKPAGVKGWIDFWVICDATRAHLFFTSNDGRLCRAETPLADFPRGWTDPAVVLTADIFEASHTYRLKDRGVYLTIVEAQGPADRRHYKAYLANRLDGAWRPLADSWDRPFAGQTNVRFAPGVEPWTDCVSHGELIRDGNDETMTVDPANLQFLIQGCRGADREGKSYGQFPWRIGLLKLRH